MAKKSKVKAAVAGAAVAAALAAATVGGGGSTDKPDKAAYADAVLDLQNAVDSLINVAGVHGVELPEKPGINDLVDGMDGVAPVDGYTTYATVSSTGAVGKGDPVRYALEPSGGIKSLRSTGLGSYCTVLAVASGAEDWTNSTVNSQQNTNSAYVYTSGNSTRLQVMNKNGYSAYATLCTVEATSADVYCNFDDHIFVAWSEGETGMLAIYKVNAQNNGISLSRLISTPWTETGAPNNVRMTCSSVDAMVSILCTKADNAGARYGAVFDVHLPLSYDKVISMEETKLTADTCPELFGLDPDPGAKGWDIAYANSDNYCFDRVVVTCPTTNGGQALIWTERDESGATVVQGYVMSKIKGGVDAALSEVMCEGGPETLLLAQTVRDEGTSRVYMELLWRRRSDGKPAIMIWGYVPGSDSAADIEQLHICNDLYMHPYTSMSGASVMSWVTDGGLYTATVELSPTGALRLSPAVRVTDTSGVGAMMERGGGTAKVLYMSNTINEGYVDMRRRVSSCNAERADGYALVDAQAGESIQFMRTKTW